MHPPPAPPQSSPSLVITTVRAPDVGVASRAARIAAFLRAPFLERRGLGALDALAAHTNLYVVGRAREEVVTAGGSFFVQPGLYTIKNDQGFAHPFLRALSPEGQPVESILDCTLGLANDALHAAGMLGARVTGVEKSPVLQCLLEEGLARMARENREWSPGAARIELLRSDAEVVLCATETDAFDVIMLDPMMSHPKRSAPGLAAVRAANLCAFDRPSAATLEEAARVARHRVVVKLGKGARPPPMPVSRAVPGAEVVYWVRELR